jgi:hypothetical protein
MQQNHLAGPLHEVGHMNPPPLRTSWLGRGPFVLKR